MTYNHTATDAYSAKMPGAGLVTAPTPFLTANSAAQMLSAAGNRVLDAMVRISERSGRVRQMQALQAKSDDELADIGLTRADIPRRVMGPLFHV